MNAKLTTRLTLFFIIVTLLTSCSINMNSIRGDKNLVTKTIEVSDYESIVHGANSTVLYEQIDSDKPYLEIELDQNLIEYMDIKVDGKTLKILPKSGYNISPSKFIVKTGSKNLKESRISGSGTLQIKAGLVTDSFHFKISGSGKAMIENIKVQSLSGSISGAGDIDVKGTADKADFNISGSGNIKAKELEVDKFSSQISGSGHITANVKSHLKSSISGSGSVHYIGNPQTDISTSGSGKIQKIEQ